MTGEALRRGQVIDDWLTANHARGAACCAADVARLHVETGDDAATSMATHHIGVCPLADSSVRNLCLQTDVAALDTTSRVLLVARPDSVYRRDGAAVWRETKTRNLLKARTAGSLVEADITAALYLVLLCSGAGGVPDALEWEELSAEAHELTILSADDDDLVESARTHVSSAVADLVGDTIFPTRVGIQCGGCTARRWCPDAPY